MAERRMFAKTIVLSDAFLNMPMSARCLYFTLGMLADDDGFVNAPRAIMRQCGASEDDMRVLIAKKFVLEFESGVIVIKHWRINNYLRNDRYTETKYADEKRMLNTDKNGSYHLANMAGIPGGIPNIGIPRLGKDSIGKGSIGENSVDIDKGMLNKDVCAEASPAPAAPPIISMPCIKGEVYKVTQEAFENDKETYPAVDVLQEYKNMKRWLETNKTKLKTKRGMPRFINNWLAKEQDKGGKGADKNDHNRGNHSKPDEGPRTVYNLKPRFAGHKYDADGNDITNL